ncbi:hypothetical protein [Paracoccus aerodenitrificans]|nr:hypothetical protein [Paracoccus aerodenitrificans]WBU63140.1 hypothetical protein PAE61_12315 [Paracoccus aerodenitrificans]
MIKMQTLAAAAAISLIAAASASAACSGKPHDKTAETSEPVVLQPQTTS